MKHTKRKGILPRFPAFLKGFFGDFVACFVMVSLRVKPRFGRFFVWPGMFLLGFIAVTGGCEGADPSARAVVRVSAAASLGPVLEALVPQIEAALGVQVQLNLAGSGTLARQVLDGAPADVVVLAHPAWMKTLADAGLVDSAAVVTVARNTLVVVGQRVVGKKQGFATLEALANPRFSRTALGDPASVPAGRYAQQALQAVGVWSVLKDRLVTTADVRAAFNYAQLGQVDAAIVYASDVVVLQNLVVLHTIDPALHKPITYPAAAVGGSAAGQRVVDWLQNSAAREALIASGFEAP